MTNNIFPAIKLTLICLVFFSGIYTLTILGLAQMAPNNGKGEIITNKDKSYYVNIAQDFSNDNYFSSRPSAVNYNAAGSSGSNKGPSNPQYLADVQARIDTFLIHNPQVKVNQIPSDLVTTSGSGLDPNISVEAAKIQVKRLSKIHHINESTLLQLIDEQTEKPLFGILGTTKINVLKLNIALQKISTIINQ